MVAYLVEVQQMLSHFEHYHIIHIPRSTNTNENLLPHLALAIANFTKTIPIEFLLQPSILMQNEVRPMHTSIMWMDPIIDYLKDGMLLADKIEAKRMRCKFARSTLIDGVLYKRGFASPCLRCHSVEEADYVMCEVY